MKNNFLSQLDNVDWASINAEYFNNKFLDIFGILIKKCIYFKNNTINDNQNIDQEKTVDLKSDFQYKIDEHITIKKITHNIKESTNWSKEISFKDSIHSKDTKKVFVPLDFFLTPKRTHFDSYIEPKIPLDAVNFSANNIIILGGPGAGKTTLMKKVFIDTLENRLEDKNFSIPFVIQFRYIENISNELTIHELLYEYFGLDIKVHLDVYNIIGRFERTLGDSDAETDLYENEFDIDFDGQYSANKQDEDIDYDEILDKYKTAKSIYESQLNKYNKFKEQLITEFIDQLNLLLIFDGFDELPSNQAKINLIKSIEKLSLNLNRTKFILTSRTGEFDVKIPNSKTYEIADLNPPQINQFINNWFGDASKASKMREELDKTPYKDTALRPLNLAHLCALFERNGEIPRKPKTVYRKIVNLLIEEWDEQRNIRRESKFSQFTLDRKFDFLCHLSYYLTAKLVKVFFTIDLLKKCYEEIHDRFQLPSREINIVINELESFTGLFVRSGYDRFEFSHKSLQEYLAGEYLVKTNLLLARKQFLLEMPSELAVAISLSSNPSTFLATILFELNQFSTHSNFLFPLFQRITLENPDFESNYFLPLSLIYLYDNTKKHNPSNLEEAKKLIFSCAPKETIERSFQSLRKKYWKIEEMENDTIKVRIVGDLSLNLDLESLKVPSPYDSFIEMDEFIQSFYFADRKKTIN